MSQDTRHQADWLGGAGYLGGAPDQYWWGSILRCLRAIIRELGTRQGRTFDIEATRTWLTHQYGCTGLRRTTKRGAPGSTRRHQRHRRVPWSRWVFRPCRPRLGRFILKVHEWLLASARR